jgi:hypothetical protein
VRLRCLYAPFPTPTLVALPSPPPSPLPPLLVLVFVAVVVLLAGVYVGRSEVEGEGDKKKFCPFPDSRDSGSTSSACPGTTLGFLVLLFAVEVCFLRFIRGFMPFWYFTQAALFIPEGCIAVVCIHWFLSTPNAAAASMRLDERDRLMLASNLAAMFASFSARL